MTEAIPLFEIPWDDGEVKNVVDSVTRGSYWAKGPYVSEFEERIEEYLGVEHAIAVNSGTTALVAALAASDVGRGDEVIVPSFTFIATVNAVELVGATPVFADVERETYGLDPDAVHEAITPATAAIVPVHPYGGACKIRELREVVRGRDVALIEDAAESFGTDVDGTPVGTFGDAAALSFCQNKVVATGEGGAVVTDDEDLAEELRLFRSHGRASEGYFESADSGRYVAVGSNLRMADVVAAVGCAQLDKVEDLIAGRRRAAGQLDAAFEDVDGVEPYDGGVADRSVYQLYTVTLGVSIDRGAVVETLADADIDSKVYWDPPVHRTEYYRTNRRGVPDLPVTDEIASRVLSLPMHPELSAEETDRIASAVRNAISAASP